MFTREQTIEEHRKLWDWLANNPGKTKSQYPEWYENGGRIPFVLYDCFPCDFTGVECEKCPFIWPDFRCTWQAYNDPYCKRGGLFGGWLDAIEDGRLEEAAQLAAQIRDLPVRPEKEETTDEPR